LIEVSTRLLLMLFSLTKGTPVQSRSKNTFFSLLAILLFVVAFYFRTSGLFRGLGARGYIFHPDEAKQILALFNFLSGEYVRYYQLFPDGHS